MQSEPTLPIGRYKGAKYRRSEPSSEGVHGYAVYHDRYERTPDGWKFAERVYEVEYFDTTPLAGSGPAA